MENENQNIDVNEEVVEETTEKTYTLAEVEKLMQQNSDKRVNQALAKQKKEYEKKLSLSSLDEQQRKEAEAKMRIEELEGQLAQFQIEKNRSELKSVLGSRGLDVRFADIINITDDIEASQGNIDTLDKIFKAAVKAEVEKRLASNAPRGNGSMNNGEITKEQFNKMSISEQAALFKSNPELYKALV